MGGYTVPLASLLIIATFSDIRHQRIPNWLTFSAIVFGLGSSILSNGSNGFLYSIGGIALGMAFLMVFYVLGGTGAGDVKLMGAVGAFLGPWGVFNAFIWTALVGGVYSIGMILFHSRLKSTRTAVAASAVNFFATKKLMYNAPQSEEKRPKLCYGIAIAVGTILSLFVKAI